MQPLGDSSWQTALLLAYTGGVVRQQLASIEDLDHILQDYGERISAAWPELEQSPEIFLRHLADVLHKRKDETPVTILGKLPVGDLYLASACANGCEAAIDAFRGAYVPSLRKSLGKLGASASTIDETEQQVLDGLFVAEQGQQPQISSYSGRGELRSWLRSVAVRSCRRLMGGDKTRADVDEMDVFPGGGVDPEIAYLKEHYRDEFRTAFVAALGVLTKRERNVLRQHHIDGLSIDQLGGLYNVHRATAARWVASARMTLLDETRSRLVAQLGIRVDEVDSIIRLVRSQLDVSIHQLLRQ